MPASEVFEFVKANPDVMLDLLSRLYRGVEGVLGRMVHLMSSNASSRLMYELLLNARRFGKTDKAGHHLGLSEGDLAARTGLTRETVSREIHKLKDIGLIKVEKQGLVITDIEALEKLLTAEA